VLEQESLFLTWVASTIYKKEKILNIDDNLRVPDEWHFFATPQGKSA
jgi:hypothetical protein